MGQLTAAQVITYCRAQGALPSQNSASDTDFLGYITTAQKDLAMEVRRPGALWTFTIVPQANPGIIPEYRLRPYVDVKKVTLNGLILVPTDIPSMEGAQIQLYDASSTNYGPQWTNAASQLYPPGGSNGFPSPQSTNTPWIIGARPNYYLRDDAQIGFVPPPQSPGTVQMDVITMPQDVTSTQDQLPFDSLYLDALGWRTLQKAHEADSQDPMRATRADRAQRNWLDGLKRIWTFIRTNNTGNPSSIVPLTVRGSGNVAPATYPLVPGQ